MEFVLLMVFWLVMSGRFQAKYIILGVISAALVTWFSNDSFYSVLRLGEFRPISVGHILGQLWRFLLYVPWLIYQIIMANVQVAYYVLHPKLPVDPGLLLFHTEMKKGMSQVTLANSITLTPGTITAWMEDGHYTIHTLKRPLAGLLEEGTMQVKVARIFKDVEDPAPDIRCRWVCTLEEMAE